MYQLSWGWSLQYICALQWRNPVYLEPKSSISAAFRAFPCYFLAHFGTFWRTSYNDVTTMLQRCYNDVAVCGCEPNLWDCEDDLGAHCALLRGLCHWHPLFPSSGPDAATGILGTSIDCGGDANSQQHAPWSPYVALVQFLRALKWGWFI